MPSPPRSFASSLTPICLSSILVWKSEAKSFTRFLKSTRPSLVKKNSVKTEHPTVIDTCSCPGGKSFSMAVNLENEAEIHSMDLHENRLRLVRSGAERLGITCIQTHECDGRKPLEEFFGKADAVVCDVPCSGLGVIAKKPDIRYKAFEEIERLPEVMDKYNIKTLSEIIGGASNG